MSAKKQKKQKGKTLSLQEFTASLDSTPSAGQNVVYAPATRSKMNMSSWADEVEEDELITAKERIVLPSAPRAARGPAYDDTQIPRTPPFTVHLGNLNYDIGEDDVHTFFGNFEVKELRLPRDTNNRLRGFGYVEFATRPDLVDALCMNEQMLRGRPVRISLGQPGTGDKDGRQRRGGGGPSFVDETPDDWRTTMGAREPAPAGNDFGGRNDGYGRRDNFESRNRDFGGGNRRDNRDNYGSGSADPEPDFSRSDFGTNRPTYGPPRDDFGGGTDGPRRDYGRDRRDDYGSRDRDFGNRRGGDYGGGRRDRDGDFGSKGDFGPRRDNYGDRPRNDYGGSSGGPPSYNDYGPRSNDFGCPPPPRTNDYNNRGNDSSYGPPRERDLGRREYGSRSHSGSESGGERSEFRRPEKRSDDGQEEDMPRPKSPPRERKKLVLAPRTVPKDSDSEPLATSSIFGGAKPVDTAAREREIEKKLEKMAIIEPEREPRQIRILQRPHPPPPRIIESARFASLKESRILEEESPILPVEPNKIAERFRRPIEKISVVIDESSPSGDDAAPTRNSPGGPPPPPTENPWTTPRARPSSTTDIERDTSSYRRRSSDESSPPDECKDTNSEPEDERDLHGSASDSEFQKVERKPRKSASRTGTGTEEYVKSGVGGTGPGTGGGGYNNRGQGQGNRGTGGYAGPRSGGGGGGAAGMGRRGMN